VSGRSTIYGEHQNDPVVASVNTWRMVRTATAKYIESYDASGAVVFREYYDLVADPAEKINLLGDGSATNDPPASVVQALASRLATYARCAGSACVG
jgi:hypothetical protein